MSSLAFSASPIDFEKNEKLSNKINTGAQKKLSTEFLKKMTSLCFYSKTKCVFWCTNAKKQGIIDL